MSNSLGVFAKYWEPGRVKTRLARFVGDQNAARFYRQMLETVIQRLETVSAEKTLYFDPPDRLRSFQEIASHWRPLPQPAGNLTERLKHFFGSQFVTHTKVIVVGSDCPQLTGDEINYAFGLLDEFPMVIGPADDGGYYLLGLSRPADFLFDEITWSSEIVYQQTIDQAKRNEIKYSVLPTKYDVDDQTGLRQFVEQFESNKLSLALSNLASLGRQILNFE